MYTKWLHMVAVVLLVVGGLNWGLVGLFNLNLVMWILGTGMLANFVYVLVGLSAVYVLVTHKGNCRVCSMKGKK